MTILKNPKHEAFAQGLALGKTADDAYASAGFKPNRGNATRLKANESITARIEEILSRGAERAEVSVARIVEELARIGFSDLRKAFTPGGSLRDPSEWDDATAAAISSVEVTTRPTGERDDDGRAIVERIHKIKLWDKNSALEKLAKHLGMFVERVEHSGQIDVRDTAADDAKRKLAAVLAAGGRESVG